MDQKLSTPVSYAYVHTMDDEHILLQLLKES